MFVNVGRCEGNVLRWFVHILNVDAEITTDPERTVSNVFRAVYLKFGDSREIIIV